MAKTRGEPGQFTAILRVSPTEQVREQLLEAIEQGVYPVGSLLPSERRLRETFGVSRVSVREALVGLEALGVIAIHHGKGAIVQDKGGGSYQTPFGEYLNLYRDDIVELLKVRRALDELAASEAAANDNEQVKQPLSEACEAFTTAAHRDPISISEVAECDEQFHVAVAAASGGKLLPGLIDELNGVLKRSRQLTLAHQGQLDRSVQEHQAIADAIFANESERARAAAGIHIHHILDWLESEDTASEA